MKLVSSLRELCKTLFCAQAKEVPAFNEDLTEKAKEYNHTDNVYSVAV